MKSLKKYIELQVSEPAQKLFENSKKSFGLMKEDFADTSAKVQDYFETMSFDIDQVSGEKIIDGMTEAFHNTKSIVESFDTKAAQEEISRQVMDAYRMLEKEDINNIWGFALLPILVSSFLFARYFPPATSFLCGKVCRELYVPANFKYDYLTRFDDSFLTWGTDFVLAGIMGYLGYLIHRADSGTLNRNVGRLGAFLMALYSASTFSGAVCHLFLPGLEKMNTWYFRALWRVCVGTVAFAGGNIGAVATELALLSNTEKDGQFFTAPVIPHFVWFSWSVFFFGVVFWGLFSMKIPACDIFLTGVTQVIPTVYLVVVLYSRRSWKKFKIGSLARQIFLFGALANIPLLPGYDLFNFLDLPLGIINLILHTNLAFAWSAQGYSILKFKRGVQKYEIEAMSKIEE